MRDCVGVVVVLVLALALLVLLAFFLKREKRKGNKMGLPGNRKNVNQVDIPFYLI